VFEQLSVVALLRVWLFVFCGIASVGMLATCQTKHAVCDGGVTLVLSAAAIMDYHLINRAGL
jgi:hypothetical protein